jgi:hypothetical protein
MSSLKSESPGGAVSTVNSRRSLLWKLGAGVSAVFASTAGVASAATARDDGDELAIRKLHEAYERAMDKGLHDDVIGMFAADAAVVVFNGRGFGGREMHRLYREMLPSGNTGKRMEPAPGFELAAADQQDRVDISPDGRSAKAVFPYSIQVGTPVETASSLASMARLHGEGVRTWWEGGVYDVSYTKDANDRWKIRRLEYRTLSRADYRAGRSHARAMTV